MKNSIFYFTGTGNSLKVAKDIIKKTNETEWNIISIAKNIVNSGTLDPENIIGFIYPVYYCGIPKIVVEFIENIDLSKVTYIFTVALYGANGGNGGCIHQFKNILTKKNKKLNAGFYIKTIDNFLLWGWDIPSEEKQCKINILTDRKINIISECILSKDEYFDISFMEYIGPIIFGYKRFIKNVNKSDKSFNIGSKCNSCGICKKVCPTYNIEINNGIPEWKSINCQKCLACLHLCPQKTIEHGKITVNKQRYKNKFIKLEELYN